MQYLSGRSAIYDIAYLFLVDHLGRGRFCEKRVPAYARIPIIMCSNKVDRPCNDEASPVRPYFYCRNRSESTNGSLYHHIMQRLFYRVRIGGIMPIQLAIVPTRVLTH